MSKLLVVGTTAVECAATPFDEGFNAVAVNFTDAAINLTGSDTQGGTYTAVATVPAAGMVEIAALPKWIKASAASVYIIE
jgi:hypothetical protein